MGSIFYLDYDLGIDSGGVATATPLGWWSVAFNGGSTAAPTAGDAVTGATSTHHGHLTVVGTITGSWAGNNAAGVMYFYGCDDLIHTGEQIDWHDGHAHTTAAAVYNPWKTITAGPTAARMAPGDTVRIAKSPAPFSIGTATWTNLSKVVTLDTANLTYPIAMCETDWDRTGTHATSCLASATDWKEGSKKVSIVEDASPGANEEQAFFATGTLAKATMDDYQAISFWIKNEVAIADNARWVIKLCSDVAGVTELDVFVIPAIPLTGRWIPLTIARTGGGNLSNNGATDIKSIAVYNGASLPTASKYIYLDNIIAVKVPGLNLQSLISKSSADEVGATEGWYPIQSINGTAVWIDNDTNTLANAGRGYSTTGTTPENIASSARETTKTPFAATAQNTIQESGTYGLNESFLGGWDTATNTRTGETLLDGLGIGTAAVGGLYVSSDYITIDHIGGVRYYYGVNLAGGNITVLSIPLVVGCSYEGVRTYSFYTRITNIFHADNNANYGVHFGGGNDTVVTTVSSANNNSSSGFYANGGGPLNAITTITNANNNGTSGFQAQYVDFNIGSLSTSNNSTSGLLNVGGNYYVKTATIAEGTKFTGSSFSHGIVYIDSLAGATWVFMDDATINSQAVTRGGASGNEWKIAITDLSRRSDCPAPLSIARIAVVANKQVTVTAYLTKSHATNIEGAIRCKGGQIAGAPSDIQSSAMAANTNPQQLTILIDPTAAGVIEIEALAWYVAAAGNVLVDTIGISQAA